MEHLVTPYGKAIIHELDLINVKHNHGDIMLMLLSELGAPVECTSLTGNTWKMSEGYTWYWETQPSHGCMLYMFAWTKGTQLDDRLYKMVPKQIEYKRETNES